MDRSESMVVRVAQAIATARSTDSDDVYESPPDWEPYEGEARAAIAAMHKADKPMSWAGAKHINGTNAGSRAYRVWEAMITAALDEPSFLPSTQETHEWARQVFAEDARKRLSE